MDEVIIILSTYEGPLDKEALTEAARLAKVQLIEIVEKDGFDVDVKVSFDSPGLLFEFGRFLEQELTYNSNKIFLRERKKMKKSPKKHYNRWLRVAMRKRSRIQKQSRKK